MACRTRSAWSRPTRSGRLTASSPSNSVTPDAPTVPDPPTGATATAGDAQATVSLDRAVQRWESDHRLHRDVGPGRRDRQHPRRDVDDGDRADERHGVHVQRGREQRGRARPMHRLPSNSVAPTAGIVQLKLGRGWCGGCLGDDGQLGRRIGERVHGRQQGQRGDASCTPRRPPHTARWVTRCTVRPVPQP